MQTDPTLAKYITGGVLSLFLLPVLWLLWRGLCIWWRKVYKLLGGAQGGLLRAVIASDPCPEPTSPQPVHWEWEHADTMHILPGCHGTMWMDKQHK